jgi:hypothetical protein
MQSERSPSIPLQDAQHLSARGPPFLRHSLAPLCALVLQSEVVVYGNLDILLGTQIPFGGLEGGVSQEELNLL